MKIHELMIKDPITITADASIEDALELMKTNSIRHLPVISSKKRLEGFLTLADLKQGLIPSMLGDVFLSDLMVKDPIVVKPDDEIDIAAQLIYKNKISGLPVVKGDRLVGILTESDILRAFIDMMGILTATSRIDVKLKKTPQDLNRVISIINDAEGEIINIGMTAPKGSKRICYFRLTSCKTDKIRKTLEKEGYEVVFAVD